MSDPAQRLSAALSDRYGIERELLDSPAAESSPTLSPNGKWLAFGSDESGRSEVYVRPFPDTRTARWQVSTTGGENEAALAAKRFSIRSWTSERPGSWRKAVAGPPSAPGVGPEVVDTR